MVRRINAAADAGELRSADVPALLNTLNQFDEIFAVLKDDDEPKVRRVLDWARAEGKLENASKEMVEAASTQRLSDAQVEEKIGEMKKARAARDFKTSDDIRAELGNAGVIVEITKDGIRWKRK
jgi:cysteinyl-tRNA synthetase